MQFFAFLLCTAVIALAVEAQDGKKPETMELHPPVGRVRGSLLTSRLGKKIYSFRGLRYAEPPVGDRRFQQSVPVVPWKDVFDATQDGPSCPQIGGINPSEDCLRLNIYTNKLPSATKSGNQKRPVIVFFHPGAFYVFSGQSVIIGPEYLLDHDIVLVTVNYRIGTLGFISTGDAHAPGNLGMKDQVVALKWIRDNIASFGGDPNSVTITGHSAGAWSCILHLVSPMTKGLFHRIIALSGSPIYQTDLPTQQIDIAKKQAGFVGCPTDTIPKMMACLKTADAQQLGDSLPKFFEWHGNPVLIWSPVVEPDIPGVDRYLSAQPGDLFRQGKFHDVPVITGVTKDEFAGLVLSMVEAGQKGNMSTFDDLNENWETIAPISFYYERGTPRSREISKALKQFYFQGKPVGLDNYKSLAMMYDDALVSYNSHKFLQIFGHYTKKPVYYYELTYQGRFSHSVWTDTQKPFGVVHHDDLLYIFWDSYFPYFNTTDPEYKTVQRMTAIFANFAKTGKPIPRNNPVFANVVWTPFTVENKKYLDIGEQLVMKTDLKGDRMREWDRLFPYPEAEERCHNNQHDHHHHHHHQHHNHNHNH